MENDIIDRGYVERELARYRIPGMGLAAIRDGKVLFCSGYGYRDVEKRLPITGDTEWGIASCSKSFTSLLVGMLADEGLFGLDQPVQEYLPDFRMYDAAATKLCTLRDMLTHRTGLGGYDALWVDDLTRADLWARLRYLKPNKPFRGAVQYSNLMYIMAGHVCEKMTGQSWEELVRERIFLPLGMTRTNTSIRGLQQSGDYAQPYWQGATGPFRVENWNVELGGPAASINSTLHDMLKWVQFHIAGGVTPAGRRLIKCATLDELHTPQVPYQLWSWAFPEVQPIGSYAMGWWNDMYRGFPMYAHTGEIEGYTTVQCVLPREKLGIVLFNNLHKPCILPQLAVLYPLLDRLLGLSFIDWSTRLYAERTNYGHMLEDWRVDLMGTQAPSAALSHTPEAYVGTYANPGHGDIRIVREGADFFCVYRGVRQPMEHWHYDIFRVPHIKMDTLLVTAPLGFHTSLADGSVDGFEFRLYEQVGPIFFTRKL